MVNYLKNQGVSDTAVNVVVIMTAAFMFLFAGSLIAVSIYDSFLGRAVPVWIGTTLGLFASFGVTLLTGHTTTAQINGSAAKTAVAVVESMNASASSSNNFVQANTLATQENTAATLQQNNVTQKQGG